ncbi:hypothetical protein SAMN05444159_1262 [Bradyrhizobium lablabi]|uniref:Uncharacterized protein n=1 Tax=Bradyrhizobium lablabi TaxID=722472 RepID=A0A1M6LFP1_9BRAD|nr:hypothetical protein SAMN05444159_1262 [Bradyrhizobium lablabi]
MLEGLITRTRRPERLAEYEADLECPPFPLALQHVWHAFCRLSARRGSNGFSINPISWPDIDAYVRNSKMALAPWEIRIIEELDDLFRQEHSKPRD